VRKTLTALLLMLFVLFFTLSGCESHKNVPDEKTDKTLAEERILIAENTAEKKLIPIKYLNELMKIHSRKI
jgi:uncharacterized protein YcfL